jgi:hypothetical protein
MAEGLGVLDRPVAGQLLNIAQAATYLEHQPGGIGDEGAAPRVRCAALEPELAIKRPNQFTTLLGRSAWPRSDRMTDPCAPCSF